MANGASRIFNVMKKTSEASNPDTSRVISLKVKSINPIVFQRDDRLEIPEDFCRFSSIILKSELKINDIVTALVLDNGQSYYIQQNETSEGSDKYLSKAGGTLYGDLNSQNIIPSASSKFSLGTPSLKYLNVYSNNFIGNLTGNVEGNLKGNVEGNASTANTLNGLTSSISELNYVKGVTSNIQNQINSLSGKFGSYLPLIGGTLTGETTMNKSSGDVFYHAYRTDTGTGVSMGVGAGGVNHGIYSRLLNKWMLYGDNSNIYLNGNANTATTANRSLKPHSYSSGSNTAGTAGWYLVASKNMNSSYEDVSATLLITQQYAQSNAGILRIKCRRDTGNAYFQSLKWLIRSGWSENNAIGVVSGTTIYIYIYTSVSQYGSIGVTVLEDAYRGGDGNLTLYQSTSPTTGLSATITSTDANAQRTSLYDNSSGTTGTVGLSESAANFTVLELYYKNSDGQYGSTTVYSPNGKITYGTIVRKNSDNTNILINSALFTISGTSITISRNTQANISFSDNDVWNDNNALSIVKVYGYR